MSNQFRWAALIALTLITIGYAYYLLSPSLRSTPAEEAPPPPTVVAEVLTDGTIQIEGQRYADAAKLKSKLDSLRADKGTFELRLRIAPGIEFENMGKAVVLLQDAGMKKVGFVTAPQEAAAPNR